MLRKNLVLHFAAVILFGILFPLLIVGVGYIFPSGAHGFPVYKNGKLIGYENVGQKFTDPKYFWGRPSACDYNAASSGASNKGPANSEYLKTVEHRIQDFLKANPEVKRQDITADLVTASGSGLDPHISLQAALIQVPRITAVRGIDKHKLERIVYSNVQHPLLGFLGPGNIINVLRLNLALDEASDGRK